MTEIVIIKNNNEIVEFSAVGHTGYAESGKDIVCASVSTILQSACLGVKEILKIPAQIEINEKKAVLRFRLPKELTKSQMKDAQIILKTMEKSLEDITFGNENYIKLEVKDEIY